MSSMGMPPPPPGGQSPHPLGPPRLDLPVSLGGGRPDHMGGAAAAAHAAAAHHAAREEAERREKVCSV